MPSIYLDFAASAPVCAAARAAMVADVVGTGNPSAVHAVGRAARARIDAVRVSVAALLDARPSAVTFTSGATEANALALLGTAERLRVAGAAAGARFLLSPYEHSSVTANARLAAERFGIAIDVVAPGPDGRVRPEDVAAALTPDTALVSVQWANNVTGAIMPVAAVADVLAAERARRGVTGRQLLFHCDASQALATQPVTAGGIDLLTVSAHKAGGPQGTGALVVSGEAARPHALYGGGGQEAGLRHGTENVAAIAGFGAAAAALREGRFAERVAAMRAAFVAALAEDGSGIRVFGDPATTLPSHAFVIHPRVPGDRLMLLLDAAGFAVSAGSACDAGTRAASPALAAALGERDARHGGVRVSFGAATAEEDLLACARAVRAAR